ncbi:MAG: hypothetical protein AAF772_19335 [Acidobacteriota bacterium]
MSTVEPPIDPPPSEASCGGEQANTSAASGDMPARRLSRQISARAIGLLAQHARGSSPHPLIAHLINRLRAGLLMSAWLGVLLPELGATIVPLAIAGV